MSGNLQQGAGGRVWTDEQRNSKLTHIFLCGRDLILLIAVGTIYSRDLHSLSPAEGDRPLRDVGQSATAASTSPQKANTVVYIFLYKKKLKIWPALKQIITVVPVNHLFFPLFFIVFVLFLCLLQLLCFSNLPFFFNVFFFFRMLNPFSSLLHVMLFGGQCYVLFMLRRK